MADKKNGTQGAGPATATETAPKRKKLPKIEAVRRAMAALGKEASRADLQGYVRQKFGVKIGLDHISNCKSELAKKAAKATTPAGPGSAATKSAAGPAVTAKPSAPNRGLLSLRRLRTHAQSAATGRPARASFWKTC